MVTESEALAVKEKREGELLSIPGVIGSGISVSSPAKINVYVEKLTPEIVRQVPETINGIPTVIIELGEVGLMQDRTGKFRPAPGGVSIGHPEVTAGTLGAVVTDNVSGKRVILSNNHILANRDSVQNPRANKGDEIWQPGRVDGGSSTDTIAKLERWIKWGATNPMTVDCAIAMPINDADIINDVLGIGKINGIAQAVEGMIIRKSGRTTGLSSGTIVDAHMTVVVAGFTWVDQIRFTGPAPQIQGGDSGSAVVDNNNNLVGLVFAGPVNPPFIYGIANKMTNVANLLNIKEPGEPEPPENGEPPEPPVTPPVTGLPSLIGGGAALMAVGMVPAKQKGAKTLMTIGAVALGGYGLYQYLKKKKEEPPEPPPTDVSADITKFTITTQQ